MQTMDDAKYAPVQRAHRLPPYISAKRNETKSRMRAAVEVTVAVADDRGDDGTGNAVTFTLC